MVDIIGALEPWFRITLIVFAFLSIVMLCTRPFCFNLSDSDRDSNSETKDLNQEKKNYKIIKNKIIK